MQSISTEEIQHAFQQTKPGTRRKRTASTFAIAEDSENSTTSDSSSLNSTISSDDASVVRHWKSLRSRNITSSTTTVPASTLPSSKNTAKPGSKSVRFQTAALTDASSQKDSERVPLASGQAKLDKPNVVVDRMGSFSGKENIPPSTQLVSYKRSKIDKIPTARKSASAKPLPLSKSAAGSIAQPGNLLESSNTTISQKAEQSKPASTPTLIDLTQIQTTNSTSSEKTTVKRKGKDIVEQENQQIILVEFINSLFDVNKASSASDSPNLKQKSWIEYDYHITNFEEDFRDGIRMARLAELVTVPREQDASLDQSPIIKASDLEYPANTELARTTNIGKVMAALDPHTNHVRSFLDASEIASGELRDTTSLLWQMISHHGVKHITDLWDLNYEAARLDEDGASILNTSPNSTSSKFTHLAKCHQALSMWFICLGIKHDIEIVKIGNTLTAQPNPFTAVVKEYLPYIMIANGQFRLLPQSLKKQLQQLGFGAEFSALLSTSRRFDRKLLMPALAFIAFKVLGASRGKREKAAPSVEQPFFFSGSTMRTVRLWWEYLDQQEERSWFEEYSDYSEAASDEDDDEDVEDEGEAVTENHGQQKSSSGIPDVVSEVIIDPQVVLDQGNPDQPKPSMVVSTTINEERKTMTFQEMMETLQNDKNRVKKILQDRKNPVEVEEECKDEQTILVEVVNLLFDSCKMPPVPCQSDLKSQLLRIYESSYYSTIIKRVDASIKHGALDPQDHKNTDIMRPINDDCNLDIRQQFINLWIESYEPPVLQAALEIVVGKKVRVMQNDISTSIQRFIENHVVFHKNTEDDPRIDTESRWYCIDAWTWKKTMQWSLALILLMDQAKLNGVISGDLFRATSKHKSSLSILQDLNTFLRGSHSNAIRLLKVFGYKVTFSQDSWSGYDFHIKNVEQDVKDGMRAARLLELCTIPMEHDRSLHCAPLLRVSDLKYSARSVCDRTLNIEKVLGALYPRMKDHNQSFIAGSIIDGDPWYTTGLLWTIIYEHGIKHVTDIDDLWSEIRRFDRNGGVGFLGEESLNVLKPTTYMGKCQTALFLWLISLGHKHNIRIVKVGDKLTAKSSPFTAIVKEYLPYIMTNTDQTQSKTRSLKQQLEQLGFGIKFSSLLGKSHKFDKKLMLPMLAFMAFKVLSASKEKRYEKATLEIHSRTNWEWWEAAKKESTQVRVDRVNLWWQYLCQQEEHDWFGEDWRSNEDNGEDEDEEENHYRRQRLMAMSLKVNECNRELITQAKQWDHTLSQLITTLSHTQAEI